MMKIVCEHYKIVIKELHNGDFTEVKSCLFINWIYVVRMFSVLSFLSFASPPALEPSAPIKWDYPVDNVCMLCSLEGLLWNSSLLPFVREVPACCSNQKLMLREVFKMFCHFLAWTTGTKYKALIKHWALIVKSLTTIKKHVSHLVFIWHIHIFKAF